MFKKDFETSNIDLHKFNFVSLLEKNHIVCDNFYILPYSYLESFSKIVKYRWDDGICKRMHNIKPVIEDIIGEKI